MAKQKIGNRNVTALAAGTLKDDGDSVDVINDTEISGFAARRLPSGKVQFSYRYYSPTLGDRRRITFGVWGDTLTADKARAKARSYAGRVVDKIDPLEAEKEASAVAAVKRDRETLTVSAVCEAFLAEDGPGAKLRTLGELKRNYNANIKDEIGAISIFDLKRSEITAMLNKIDRRGGPVMADRTLALIRRILNWQATRSDNFVSPIVRGMMRVKPADRTRDRTLAPSEIKQIWDATKTVEQARFGQMVRMLFLTACRRDELASVQEPEFREDEERGWLLEIPGERYKTGKPHVVPLSPAAVAEFNEVEKRAEKDGKKRDFIYSRYGFKKFSGFSKAKAALDAEILKLMKAAAADRGESPAKVKPLPRWTLHDIRRTCRTIMSEETRDDIAERVLGHVIGGVKGTYNRYDYAREKRTALENLAMRLAIITSGDSRKVLPLKRA